MPNSVQLFYTFYFLFLYKTNIKHKTKKKKNNTYGQSLSNSDFFVTKDSSEVSVSTCSGRAHAASSSWPHSSVLTCTQKTENKITIINNFYI